MSHSLHRASVVLALCLTMAAGVVGGLQTRTPGPDREAFEQAESLTDPAERLAALYAFGDRFPNSNQVTDSEQAIFELLVEHWPDRREEILKAIERIVSRIPSVYPVDRERESANEFATRIPTVQLIVRSLIAKRILLNTADHLLRDTNRELARFHRTVRAQLLEMSAAAHSAKGQEQRAAEIRHEVAAARLAGGIPALGARPIPPPAPSSDPPTKPRFPEDERAYLSALATAEPRDRLAALLRLSSEFRQPTFATAVRADDELLALLLEHRPDLRVEIGEVVDRILQSGIGGSREERMEGYVRLAQRALGPMVRKGVLLDTVSERLDDLLARLDHEHLLMRVDVLQLTGGVQLAAGNTSGAEATYRLVLELNSTLNAGPQGSDPAVHRELAKMELARGRDSAALNHLLTSAIMRRPSAVEGDQLRALFRKVHGASADLESALDAAYRQTFPNPIRPTTYTSTTPGQRTVLVEMFSGAGCQPCRASDLAHEAILHRYGPEHVIAVAYHVDVPLPDPLSIPAGEARHDFYDETGVPTLRIDGVRAFPRVTTLGGDRNSADTVFRNYTKAIDRHLAVPARGAIRLKAMRRESEIIVTANVHDVAIGSREPQLMFLLVEKQVRYTGENGIRFHPMVVRAVAGPPDHEFTVAAAGPSVHQHRFDLTAITSRVAVDPSNLVAVAFIQDAAGTVLQAVQATVPGT